MDYNKCVVRNNEHLVTEYKLFDKSNRLKIENKYLRNESNSTKIRQMKTSNLHAIKSYLAKERFYLWETKLLKNPLCFDNVCKEIVPETFMQKRINTVGIKITELEQLQHKQIFNNSEITKWAKNCNKLKTEIATCEKKELFNLIMNLIGQLNEKAEIINHIVGDAENIRCKLVDEAKKSIEKDNRIKEITLEKCQLRKENEKARVEMLEFVKKCSKVVNSSEERLKIQDVELFKRRNDGIRHDTEVQEYKNIILELESEISCHIDLNRKLNIKHDELQNKYDGLKVKYYEQNQINESNDNDINDSNAKIINSKIIAFKQIDISGILLDSQIAELTQKLTQRDNELCECVKQKNDAQSELTLLTESRSKLSAEFDELNNKHQTLKTQFDELSKTIESNKHKMDKLWKDKLNSADKKTKIKEAELVQIINQLRKELSDLKMTNNPAKNFDLTKKNSNLRQLQTGKKVRLGKDAKSNILQAKENSIVDTAEKEKEKSEENPNLIKERKQSSNPSEIAIKRKVKADKEIMATSSMVNSQCCPKKPVQKNANLLLRKPFR